MEFLAGIFVGSVFWPIALGVVWCIVLIACAENQRGYVGLLSTAVFFGLLYVMTQFSVLNYIYTHPISILMYIGIYLVIGMGYSILRWDRYVAKWYAEYYNDQDARTKEQRYERRPTASTSKNRIIHWMAYWPWSGLWWLLSDFLTEVFSFLYRRLGGVYEMIEKRHTPTPPIPSIEVGDGGLRGNRQEI